MRGPGGVFSVQLQETPTLQLYHQENTSVHEEDHLAHLFISEWQTYHQKRSSGAVRAREMTCQTVPRYTMDKMTQKSATTTKESGCMATQWSMYDEYHTLNKTDQREPEVQGSASQMVFEYYVGEPERQMAEGGVEVARLLRGLGWVERQLSSTEHIRLLHTYMDDQHQRKQDKEGGQWQEGTSEGCRAQQLWNFSCDVTQGYRVNDVTFCSNSPWLVLVAYGNPSFTSPSGGLLCGWSAKRIAQPEIRLPLPGPATVVSSCPSAPQLCCVALLDGALHVYQLDTPTPQLVLDTSGSIYKQCAPVWSVEWRHTYHTLAPTRPADFTGAPPEQDDSQGEGTTFPTHPDDSQGEGTTFPTHLDDSQGEDTTFPAHPDDSQGEVITSPTLQDDSDSDLTASTLEGRVVGSQALVSASEDGTVKEWIFTCGRIVRCTTLMRVCLPPWVSLEIAGGIQEVLQQEEGEGDPQGGRGSGGGGLWGTGGHAQLLPESVPATALRFRPGDSTSYLVGTVAGHLLLCRTFERRGSVAVFRGHTGLVTSLDWRAGPPGDAALVFLSSALDDTIRVWHLEKRKSRCVLRNPQVSSGTGGYVDACWCPWYGNLIAGVHGGGLHLWDISLSTHTPILTQALPGATCVTFSPHTRNVVVGDRAGSARVIHLTGLAVPTSSTFQKFCAVLSRISMLGCRDDQEEEEE